MLAVLRREARVLYPPGKGCDFELRVSSAPDALSESSSIAVYVHRVIGTHVPALFEPLCQSRLKAVYL